MTGTASFQLPGGAPVPRQCSRYSCGAACLVFARMLIDADLVSWVAADPDERFAAAERTVLARTNALTPRPGSWQAPWPRGWGTPPWGAKAELEGGASVPGTRVEYVVVRGQSAPRLKFLHDMLTARVRFGAPALLYVGQAALPRHVTLVFRDRSTPGPFVYEPLGGAVSALSRTAFARGELGLGGWDVPWLLIQPRAQRAAHLTAARRALWLRAGARRVAAEQA